MHNGGTALLQSVAERILAAHLKAGGARDVEVVSGFESLGGHGVDIIFSHAGKRTQIKVKPDPYFGTDPAKINDRSRVFYRANVDSYAFEAVANTATRAPGWIFSSPSDEIFYYRLALTQQEDEVSALVGEPDEVFFSELAVERDDLLVMDMAPTRAWFETHFDDYTSRPVMLGGAAAWYRLVPRADIERAVVDIDDIGPVFEFLRYR